jgi:hypothetical protein
MNIKHERRHFEAMMELTFHNTKAFGCWTDWAMAEAVIVVPE